MIPSSHSDFVNRAIDVLKNDSRIVGIAAGGSWITDAMDEFSDIDLVIVVETCSEHEVSEERLCIAGKLGNLLSGFTGEHVGEPRLLICLYGTPLLHVDLKFVALPDFSHRVENPVILWERDNALSSIVDQTTAAYPMPDLQWIEDRFWVWVHYAATKIGRGEVFEAIETLSFLRTTVLGPLSLMKNGCLPRGMRCVERDIPETLFAFKSTLADHDAGECIIALNNAIALYKQLRSHHKTPELILRTEAEESSINYLNSSARFTEKVSPA
ncbi:TPA: oxalate:formate antiporter [Candidatus Sumerlaeota bacterium]|nr:oxalate:formate antiporter [Candidatus Sumerlaeota bacterium]